MKNHLCNMLMAAALMGAAQLSAQTATDPGEGLRAAVGSTSGTTAISWWGKAGRTYFVQTCVTLMEADWRYVPVIESGTGAVITWSLSSTAQRGFVRLVYTDQAFVGSAAEADFDGDGLTNAAEIAAGWATDPFLRDSDWDGYADGAEAAAGTDPHAGASNPGTTQPPAAGTGLLNPDARYRNGLRLDYARQSMLTDMESHTSNSATTYDSLGYANQVTASGPNVPIYAYQRSTTADITGAVVAAFQAAGFLAPAQSLFETTALHTLEAWEQKAHTVSQPSGDIIEQHYLNRNRYEITAVASPAAALDARRSLVMLLYDQSTYSATLLETGTLDISLQNVSASANMVRHCQIMGNKVVVEPRLEANPPDENPAANVTWSDQHFYLKLMDVDIEPDTGMAGVLGDVVKSAKPGSKVRHFVTPKAAAGIEGPPEEINQPYVEFKALGVTNAAQFDLLYEWEGGVAGSDSTKRKVSRTSTGEDATTLRIKTKKDKVVVDEMKVWVVWCEGTIKSSTQPFEISGTAANAIRASIEYEFAVQPKKAISEQDHPDFSGTNTDVPNKNKTHVISGTDIAGGATLKWDVSRQVRIKILNPHLYPVASLAPVAGHLWAGQPDLETEPESYPTLTAEGNDDKNVNDEQNDPYTNDAKLGSNDDPAASMFHSTGENGHTFIRKYHFAEFVRLNLGGKWYVISDFKYWRVHYHFLRTNGQWHNNNSSLNEGNQNW